MKATLDIINDTVHRQTLLCVSPICLLHAVLLAVFKYTALKHGDHVTDKKGNGCRAISHVTLCRRKQNGRCWSGKLFGKGEEKEEGRDLLVTWLLYFFIMRGCQESSNCLDEVENLPGAYWAYKEKVLNDSSSKPTHSLVCL